MLILCSAKGGSGTTVVAASLALLHAQRGPCLLVDLAGDLPAALGIAGPQRSITSGMIRSRQKHTSVAPEKPMVIRKAARVVPGCGQGGPSGRRPGCGTEPPFIKATSRDATYRVL